MDETAAQLGAVGAYGGCLDALLNERRDLYSETRDQFTDAHYALAGVLSPGRPACPWMEDRNSRVVLHALARAAGLQAKRLSRSDEGFGFPPLADDDTGSAQDLMYIAEAARAWRTTCRISSAGPELAMAGPLACALEMSCVPSVRDVHGKQALLHIYDETFEALLQTMKGVRPGIEADPRKIAAIARIHAALAEALGLVRGAFCKAVPNSRAGLRLG